MKDFFRWLLVAVVLVGLVGCSRVNGDNYLKIKEGMGKDEVRIILGEPTEVKDIHEHHQRWIYRNGNAKITVDFEPYSVANKSSENL